MANKDRSTIVVGMSGGVDSSVAALVLKQQGHNVIGVFMKNWEDTPDNGYRAVQAGCTWEDDAADVRAVCQQLDIPYLTFDFVKEYRQQVFTEFLRELEAGRTPNPDILCNQKIKFDAFLKKSLQLPDVSAVATGHYAQLEDGVLSRPTDLSKDQTYFLYRIDPAAFPFIRFPLAHLLKSEVRALAEEHQLVTARKRDSTGICFIGDIDYRTFVQTYLPMTSGDIVDLTGRVLGEHHGLPLYTIGQRTGLNIGGSGPYYVVSKNAESNQLVVTNNSDHPQLFTEQCTVTDLHWLTSVSLPLTCEVQIRYRQAPQLAELLPSTSGQVHIVFKNPQRAITPGQSAVFYAGAQVLGGGIITV